jgi:proteasome activator subunit 4
MYPAMETLIEPHRLIACMYCLTASARPMLTARKYYPEGPTHVLPLLQLALPGIDPNDFKKTLVCYLTKKSNTRWNVNPDEIT